MSPVRILVRLNTEVGALLQMAFRFHHSVENQKPSAAHKTLRSLEKSALTLHGSGRDGEIPISRAKATGWKRLTSDMAEELIRVFL